MRDAELGTDRPPTTGKLPPADPPVAVIDAKSLFAGRTEIRLSHGGAEYRLRITKQGKLILTK